MKRAVFAILSASVLAASVTSAFAYRIERVEAFSSTQGKHYLYSCICDNKQRIISYSTSPIKPDDCLTSCTHAGSGYGGPQFPLKATGPQRQEKMDDADLWR